MPDVIDIELTVSELAATQDELADNPGLKFDSTYGIGRGQIIMAVQKLYERQGPCGVLEKDKIQIRLQTESTKKQTKVKRRPWDPLDP